jgi:glycosyltransferase involved in cell wall biosynthesis
MSTPSTLPIRRVAVLAPAPAESPATGSPLVEIVIPVYNEQAVLERSVRRLNRFLAAEFPFPYRITVADNASSDRTCAIAVRLAREIAAVRAVRLEQKGRGRALRSVWGRSDADILCYMDVDLSTDLRGLLPLVAPLVSGHSDLAVGSRLAPGARVVRSRRREVLSRGYNRLLRTILRSRIRDAQCGFKAGRRGAIHALLPDVQDDNWFFDTELLHLAQRRGMRIHEVPVDWVEDPDSRVDIAATVIEDLRGIARLRLSAARPGRRLAAPSRLLPRSV